MLTHHILKCDSQPFAAIASGEKTFEFRPDDRDYKVGDVLYLQEFDRWNNKLTGKTQARIITYILRSGYGVPPNYAVLALREPEAKSPFKHGDIVRSEIGQFDGPAHVVDVSSDPASSPVEIVTAIPLNRKHLMSASQFTSEHYNFAPAALPKAEPLTAEVVEARMAEIHALLGDCPREDWMRPLEDEFAFCRGQLSILGLASTEASKEVPAADQAAPPEWTNAVVTGPSGLRLIMRHSSGLEIALPAWTR